MSPSFRSLAAAAAVAGSFLVQTVAAVGWSPLSNSMTAVYWGQNGAAASNPNMQKDLFSTCNDTNVDIVIVSFVTAFKGKANYPIINLSNQCGGNFPLAEDPTKKTMTDILNCPDVGTKIKQCQAIGKKILLSLGGATYTGPGWADAGSARSSANEIWAMFGPYKNPPFKYRPFGSAVVDGFDLDFESLNNKPNTNYFAAQLKGLYTQDKTKTYLLTAAPQCPHPDAVMDQALTAVAFDAVFIQFYNNLCQASSYVKNKAQTANSAWNLQMWQTWATTKSANKGIRLFTGFLAGGVGKSTGYVTKAKAQEIVTDSKRFANFGGASFWDSSILNINSAYLPGVRATLLANSNGKRAVQERGLRHPVGGPATYAADDFVEPEVKIPAESMRRSRRHMHHRRASNALP
ncbi:Endochitinase [Orbilia brochopaga]|nr:Endochitinase [Drechslerella brochopaga]